MKFKDRTYYRILAFSVGIAIAIVSMVWMQASASPATAQEPAELSLQIIISENGIRAAAVTPSPIFNVGDTFKISVVAQGVTDGIFGSQFELTYDPAHLEAIEGSLVSGEDLAPVVIAVSSFEEGLVKWAASREGDLDNVSGNVVLATLTMEAVGPTEPPEGQTTTIGLENVKLGAKGGIEVPIGGLVPLDVIIRDDGTVPGNGDIAGNVTVEGRASDNQAGHSVTATGDLGGELSDDTDTNGDFLINNAAADTYSLTADSPGFLAATCEGVVHTTDALTTLDDMVLLAGDIDGNGEIDITDAVSIGAVFGSTDPTEIANLNADGEVDILDLILMAANFGQTSAANPWVCQSTPAL